MFERFKRHESTRPQAIPNLGLVQYVETTNHNEAVLNAMMHLQPNLRAVAVLRLVQEFSTTETADMLNIPLDITFHRLSQAQTQLRTLLFSYIKD